MTPDETKYHELFRAAVRASAELRHAYRLKDVGQPVDWNLIARAIEILERATTGAGFGGSPGAPGAGTGGGDQ